MFFGSKPRAFIPGGQGLLPWQCGWRLLDSVLAEFCVSFHRIKADISSRDQAASAPLLFLTHRSLKFCLSCGFWGPKSQNSETTAHLLPHQNTDANYILLMGSCDTFCQHGFGESQKPVAPEFRIQRSAFCQSLVRSSETLCCQEQYSVICSNSHH